MNELNAGGSVGFSFAVTPHLRLLPEVAALYPVLQSLDYSGVSGTSVLGLNGFFLQVALGISIGP